MSKNSKTDSTGNASIDTDIQYDSAQHPEKPSALKGNTTDLSEGIIVSKKKSLITCRANILARINQTCRGCRWQGIFPGALGMSAIKGPITGQRLFL